MVAIFLVNSLVVILTVLIHYEFLDKLSRWLPRTRMNHRLRILVGVGGALCAHAIEVWLFALAYFFMLQQPGWGYLSGNINGTSLLDLAYFSFTVFSTLGFGDIQPEGHLRYLTGIESLTGLVMVTWTASFLFLEMEREWRRR